MENEKLPCMEVNLNGYEVEATPENTKYLAYLGSLAMYNCMIIRTKIEEQPIIGRVWKHQPGHDSAAQFMMQNGYPLHVNLREVADNEKAAYDRMIARQMEDLDQIPEDWA